MSKETAKIVFSDGHEKDLCDLFYNVWEDNIYENNLESYFLQSSKNEADFGSIPDIDHDKYLRDNNQVELLNIRSEALENAEIIISNPNRDRTIKLKVTYDSRNHEA
jgi:hypothetical protein